MRKSGLLAWLFLVLAGCGDSRANIDATAMLGSYQVTIESNGKTDQDAMSVVLGSSGTVLLNFVYSFGTIRALVTTNVTAEWADQTVQIARPTGMVNLVTSGRGTFSASGVDLTMQAFSADAGPTDDSSTNFHITGNKR